MDKHLHIIYRNIIDNNNFNLFFNPGLPRLISPIMFMSSSLLKDISISLVAEITFLLTYNT